MDEVQLYCYSHSNFILKVSNGYRINKYQINKYRIDEYRIDEYRIDDCWADIRNYNILCHTDKSDTNKIAVIQKLWSTLCSLPELCFCSLVKMSKSSALFLL